jgi:hypothetical protein
MLTGSRIPSGGITTFGPLIVNSFGFNAFNTILLNIPFGAVQIIATMGGAAFATRTKRKGPALALLCIPPIAGIVMLLCIKHTAANKGPLLVGYYLVCLSICTDYPVSNFFPRSRSTQAFHLSSTPGHRKTLPVKLKRRPPPQSSSLVRAQATFVPFPSPKPFFLSHTSDNRSSPLHHGRETTLSPRPHLQPRSLRRSRHYRCFHNPLLDVPQQTPRLPPRRTRQVRGHP